MPLGTVLNKDHKLHNLRRHDILAQLPLCFMIGQSQITFSEAVHSMSAMSPMHSLIRALHCYSKGLFRLPLLIVYSSTSSSIEEGCHREQIVSMLPHMQAEIDVHFHSLKQMYVVFHKRRDLFSVDLAGLHFLCVWT